MRCTHKMAEAVDDASPVPAEAMEDEQGVAEGGGEQAGELTPASLQEELAPIAKKWYEFGKKLGASSTLLHSIEQDSRQTAEHYFSRLLSMLADPGSEVKLSWEKIVDVLREIDDGPLAAQLTEKYGVKAPEVKEGEGEGEKTIPDLKTQNEELRALLNQRLVKGETWYLVDVRWMKTWKKYVGYDQWDQSSAGQETYFPGPLDTSNLFTEDQRSDSLKEHLMEELDYSLIPEPAWDKLVTWYGISETSRPIARRVVEYGLYMKHSKVEVYLLDFKLCIHPKLNEHTVKPFSRADTISDLEKELRSTFSVTEEIVCRVWHRYMSNTYELLGDMDQTLQDAGLYNMQTIVLERQNKDKTWPRSTTETSYSSSHSTRSQDSITGTSAGSSSHSSSSSSYRGGGGSYWSSSNYYKEPTTPGLCGLTNLGNTCFMNSALQCLSNTEPLTEYFVKDAYRKHINKDNPLGMKGQVAEMYGALLGDMWSGSYSACSPRQFKTVVGKFAPQFSGYQQHDSHELLAFLLDGLHEDLNLVRKKPFVDMTINTEGRNEKDVAEESWFKYLQRNQSVVVSVFQGQLKSTLDCPQCSQESKIFDPFMFLSLPLPVKKTRKLTVVVVRTDPKSPMTKYRVVVPKRGSISHLKNEVSELIKIPEDMIVIVDVYNSRFHRIYDNRESLTHILDRDDIFAFELHHPIGDPDWVHVPIYHREEVVKTVSYGYSSSSYTQRYNHLFGFPFIVRVPRNDCTYSTLYHAILDHCSRYMCSWEEAKERMAESEKDSEQKEDEEGEGEGEGGGEKGGEGEGENRGEGGGEKGGEGETEGEGGKEGEEEPMDQGDNESDSVPSNQKREGTSEDDNNSSEQQKNQGGGEGEADPGSAGKKAGGGSGGEEGEEEEEELAKEKAADFQMFQLSVVNAYGTQDVKKLPNDATTLRLTSQTYVACDWVSEVKEKCYDAELAEAIEEDSSCKDTPEAPKNITLYNCLDLFTVKEKLGQEDAWYCPNCKDFVQATKKFDLWKLPRVLVIHLKRFSYNRYWRDKLDTLIEFPIDGLDLRKYVQAQDEPEPVYDLFAVSNHFGGMGGGHYTAYCKNKSTGKWYNYDDSHVSEASTDRIMSASAYVLFYCRRDEGKPVPPPLCRTLSQSFAEEVKRRKKQFNPSETSCEEEDDKMEEGQGSEVTEPHPQNNNNNSPNDDDAFASSNMEQPD